MATNKTNLDLINECDNFPYPSSPSYISTLSSLYTLHIPPCSTPLGYLLATHVHTIEEVLFTSSSSLLDSWSIDHNAKTLTLALSFPDSDLAPSSPRAEAARSATLAQTAQALQESKRWRILDGWRDELYPIYGELVGERTLLCSVERAASALFGIVTYGCHMTAYVRSSLTSSSPSSVEDLKLWVPRRAATKSTYPSMLDNTVAGGIATGESPFECIVREAAEEASLPEELVRRKARSVGAVTYFHVRDERAGGETGLLMPECQFVYDLDLTPERHADGKDMEREVTPKPEDGEVEGFELMGVGEVKEAMRKGEFKPNCAVVLLDFFVRHGLMTAEDEEGFVEICGRLHRRLEFIKVDGET